MEAFGEASFTEDCVGDGSGDIWSPSGVAGSIEVLALLPPFEMGETRPLYNLPVSGGGSLTGRGNKFPRFFIRRGICSFLMGCGASPFTVPFSIEPWSDRDDSEKRMSCSEGFVPL